MLSVKQYPADHLQDSRDRFNERILRFDRLTTTISERDPAALAELEHDFAELMVVSLDAAFVHRVRAQEGKDGNPLNEVRMLADSILTNQPPRLVSKIGDELRACQCRETSTPMADVGR